MQGSLWVTGDSPDGGHRVSGSHTHPSLSPSRGLPMQHPGHAFQTLRHGFEDWSLVRRREFCEVRTACPSLEGQCAEWTHFLILCVMLYSTILRHGLAFLLLTSVQQSRPADKKGRWEKQTNPRLGLCPSWRGFLPAHSGPEANHPPGGWWHVSGAETSPPPRSPVPLCPSHTQRS